MANLVAHEIGHVLALGDVDTDPACNGTIMRSHPSYVTTDQCTAVEAAWYAPAERQADTDYDMDTCNTWCIPRCEYDWNSWFCPPGGESPILFDLSDDGFALTGTEDGGRE